MQAPENDARDTPRQMDAQWLIDATDLSKRYPRRGMEPLQAVKPTSLQVEAGEIFSLLGPNGAGKSTLISMLCGLAHPTSGDAQIGGFSIRKQPIEAKRLLGIVPQEVALYDQLSARRNMEFFGALQGLRGADLNRRIDAVLDVIDLRDRQKEKVQTFSGGMKRRVNLAVGLLNEPRILFLDEPTVGIDPQNRRRILDTVMELRSERGMTIFYTSHLMEEVQEISDRVAIMDHGEIIAQGTVPELVKLIGEEDRVVLSLGEQTIDEATLTRLRREGSLAVEFVHASANGTSGNGTSGNGTSGNGASGNGRFSNGEVVLRENALVVTAIDARSALPFLLLTLNEIGIDVRAIDIRQPDLEAVFLNLTGRQLRD